MRKASAERAQTGRWELVGLLWVAFFLNQADRQVYNVVLPLIGADLSLSSAELGLVASAFSLIYGLLVPVAGIVGDRLDRGRVVALSLVVFSLGTSLTGFASSFILLMLFRGIATGAGEAFYAPAATSLIAEEHEETRGRALALHQTANYTGIVLGSLLSGWIGQTYGWRVAFLMYGAAGLLWSVVLARRLRRHRSSPRASPMVTAPKPSLGEALRLVLTTPALLGQLLAFGGLVFVIVGFLTWSPTLLFERFGLSLAEAGFSAVFYHHALAYVGVVAAGWFTDRAIRTYPRARLLVMAFGLAASGPCIWWAAGSETLTQMLIGFALFGLFRGAYDAGIFAAIFDLVEDRLRASVTGLVLASGFVIGAASPTIMGLMKADHGLEGGLRLLAVTSVVAGAILAISTAMPPITNTTRR